MKQAQTLPNEFVQKLTSKKTVNVEFTDDKSAFGKGERNDSIFKLTCSLRRQDIKMPTIKKMMRKINKSLCKPPLSEKELDEILKSTKRYDQEATANFSCMSQIESQKVNWFWYPYMPSGSIIFVDGNPGRGKSYFTMWLAALCSNGGKFPFSEEHLPKGRVLIMNAEDDPERTMRPRLEKAGADLSPNKIHFQGRFKPLTMEGIQALEAKVISFKPNLVIIDPLLTYMGSGVDMNKFNQTTEFMTHIDELAREHDFCVLCVRHMAKGNHDNPIHKGLGSTGLSARARSILHIGVSRDDTDVIGFAHVKSNWSEKGPTLLYRLIGGTRTEWPKLEWIGVADYTAEGLDPIQSVGRPRAEPNLSDILAEILSNGSMGIKDIQNHIKNIGMDVSKSTVIRELRLIAELDGKGLKSVWKIR